MELNGSVGYNLVASMVHAGTGRWRQKNGRPMLIVGSRPAVYRMAVLQSTSVSETHECPENQ